MNTEEVRRIIAKREATSDEWQQGVEQCWEELSSALASDYDAARAFLLEDCTADEASWVSEVHDEILQKTRNEAFVELLKHSVERFPEEAKLLNMSRQLEMAIDNYLDA